LPEVLTVVSAFQPSGLLALRAGYGENGRVDDGPSRWSIANDIRAMPRIYFVPVVLAFVVPGLAIGFIGVRGLLFTLAWWIAAAIGAIFLASKTRGKRIVLTLAIMIACVLLTWEGGTLVLPALVVLLVTDVIKLALRSSTRAPRQASD
jgi:hypothetical protein